MATRADHLRRRFARGKGRLACAVWCAAVVATGVATVACRAMAAASEADPAAVRVRVESGDGGGVEGSLDAIDRDSVVLAAADGPLRLPLGEVRRLVRLRAAAAGPDGKRWSVRVVGIDGLAIAGGDFLWDDGAAAIVRGSQRITLPIERVRVVDWSPQPAVNAALPAWLAAVPAEPASDLVAVSQGEGFELVECAISGVSPDAVTVVLDGDRIPVKRSKVLGLVWARAMTPAVGTRVAIDGGSLAAATVEWRTHELLLDGQVRVPGAWLESIDFAAGRTVRFVDLPPEQSGVEPYFGGLAAVEGLAAYFAPRVVATGSGREGEPAARAWLMRPRTEATWRVPPGSRRFRATAIRSAAAAAPAAVLVNVRADDGPAWQRRLTAAEGATIDLDVTAARRMTITVDFVDGGMGCPIRFDDAVFEK